MVAEVLEHLAPQRGGVFVDCTVGLGGHAQALLEAGASRLIGLDRDPQAVTMAVVALRRFGSQAEVVKADYRDLDDVLDQRHIDEVAGVLIDLGVSSMQLDAPGRGFSFRCDEALDMRMDQTSGDPASVLLAAVDERTLADVIFCLGEERYARRIARAIVRARERGAIETTGQLAEIVRRCVPRKGYSRIDSATRTFQAIRSWTNREGEGLDSFLIGAASRLGPGGRLVALSFQSLEDRVVKHTFRMLGQDEGRGMVVRTKRPLTPGDVERDQNPRSRSAKMRVLERVPRASNEEAKEGGTTDG